MPSTRTQPDARTPDAARAPAQLYVAWQDPASRAIRPVGVLTAMVEAGEPLYEYRYIRGALDIDAFRPFVEFPDLEGVYRSPVLFPMFQNRLMPRRRSDYPEYLASLGLDVADDPDPFEVLATSFGQRATDTVEVFEPPRLDERTGRARCRFLCRGVRHQDGAEAAIATLAVGDRLHLEVQPDNPVDPQAIRLRTDGGAYVGWVPAYLVNFLHRAARLAGGLQQIDVHVEHRNTEGPWHLRLLCTMASPMPIGGFASPELEPLGR